MDTKLRELLDEEIRACLESLPTCEWETRGNAIDDLVKLYKLRSDDAKVEMEAREKREMHDLEVQEKREMFELELENKKEMQTHELQLEHDRSIEQAKDRYLKLGLDVAGIVLPLIFYGVWMGKGLKFEETGTFTSTTFRGLFNRFKPAKQ